MMDGPVIALDQGFVTAYVLWCKAAIRSAARESFATMRKLGDPYTVFVSAFLDDHPEVDPVLFLEASLSRILALNAQLPEGTILDLHEEPAAFWEQYQAAAHAAMRATLAEPIDSRTLSADRKPGKQAVREVESALVQSGLHPQRQDPRTVALFIEIPPVSVSHFFDSDDRGFCFWSAVRFPGDRIPRFTTSYAGSVGLAVRTRVEVRDLQSVGDAVRLACAWRESFDRFVRSWSESRA